MTLSRSVIEAMAPDQAALKAAAGLLKPGKWPVRERSGELIWGECQGSGANPYRVVADVEDPGSKCTCPSRKFPCKHALALMWMHADDPRAFAPAEPPAWVLDWMSRRRHTGGAATTPKGDGEARSLAAASEAAASAEVDPGAEARRQASAQKRSADTRRLVAAGLDDLETWIADQLRTGLAGFVAEAPDRCRRIAARLVDAKAGALAGRVDEAPARILALPAEARIDAAIAELGKLTLAARAWRAAPDDPELRREVVSTESREELLAYAEAPRVQALWEVLGERVSTRRDGLVSVATWLLNLGSEGPRFALLMDFFPTSAGRRSGAFAAGQRFEAELVFYPARAPLRAVVAERWDASERAGGDAWPPSPEPDPLVAYARELLASPWRLEAPILLPPGRIAEDAAGRAWWMADGMTLPIEGGVPPFALGAEFAGAAGVWNGARLGLLAGQTDWGRLAFDG
jgi:hypothetical protein